MVLPADMAVTEIVRSGARFKLQPGRRPLPDPDPGEVLIAVQAAGVNGHDVNHIDRGQHEIRAGESDLPGLEVAGEVIALGEGAERWRIGDRVCALLRGGGYAEYAVAPEVTCLPIPGRLDWTEAAALPETFSTVWSNVFVDMAFAAGESFLMNGGTSGIGVTAIQIAAVLGHTVFATARGSEKTAFCERLGARRGIDYETEDFPAVILEETGGRGVDVILDIGAGDYVQKDIDALSEGGRAAFIGLVRGPEAKISVRALMQKRLRLGGSLLRPRPIAYKAMVLSQLEERVWPHVAAGRISPMVHRTFHLADAADAIAMLEARAHVGKLVLVP